MKFKREHLILLISLIVDLLLALVVFLTVEFSITTWAYIAVVAVLILVFPYSMYKYTAQAKLKNMEEQFPMLLKDLADSLRAGLTMSQAVRVAANSEYKELSSEVKRMSNQLSWGVSFQEVIRDLISRFPNSIFITRGLSILLQAFRSGGDISPIMTSVADSTTLLQNVEKDRETTLSEQTAIIYVIQIVSVIILIVLFKVLIPLTTSGDFGAALIGGGIDAARPSMDYYKLLFFATISIQSACNGIVAGVTQSGSIVSGIRHFAIMFAIGLILYVTFILPPSLQVTAISERFTAVPGQEFSVFGRVMSDDEILSNQVLDVIVGNNTYLSLTDISGEYNIVITAPEEKGEYEGLVVVEYEGQKTESSFTFKVV